MPSKTQTINGATAVVFDNSGSKADATVKSLTICNRTAGIVTYSIYKATAANFYIADSIKLPGHTTDKYDNIVVDANVILNVTTSGNCDVDCNFSK